MSQRNSVKEPPVCKLSLFLKVSINLVKSYSSGISVAWQLLCLCPLFLFSGVKSAGRFCSLIWWNSKTKWRMKWQHFWIWTYPDPRQSSLNCLFLQSYVPQVYTKYTLQMFTGVYGVSIGFPCNICGQGL